MVTSFSEKVHPSILLPALNSTHINKDKSSLQALAREIKERVYVPEIPDRRGQMRGGV